MSDNKSSNNTSNSNIQGVFVNIGGTNTFHGNISVTMGTLNATVGAMNAAPDEKAALQKMIADLEAALKEAPAAQQADAEKPDKEVVEAKANLLKKAAENMVLSQKK